MPARLTVVSWRQGAHASAGSTRWPGMSKANCRGTRASILVNTWASSRSQSGLGAAGRSSCGGARRQGRVSRMLFERARRILEEPIRICVRIWNRTDMQALQTRTDRTNYRKVWLRLSFQTGAPSKLIQRRRFVRRAVKIRTRSDAPEYPLRLHLTVGPDSAKAAADYDVAKDRTRPEGDPRFGVSICQEADPHDV